MNRPYIGGRCRKISVGSGGITAYFGKRISPDPGSWHQDPSWLTHFRGPKLENIE